MPGDVATAQAAGRSTGAPDFERVVNRQAELERERPFRPYRDITAASLIVEMGLDPDAAKAIGADVGRWPAFPDCAPALRRLMRVAPCVAMTDSDIEHGLQAQAGLGFQLSGWVCAEEVHVYRPAQEFWHAVSRKLLVSPGPDWWHVSAYADYDGDVARALGLTAVFVERPHSRPGPSSLVAKDLL